MKIQTLIKQVYDADQHTNALTSWVTAMSYKQAAARWLKGDANDPCLETPEREATDDEIREACHVLVEVRKRLHATLIAIDPAFNPDFVPLPPPPPPQTGIAQYNNLRAVGAILPPQGGSGTTKPR